MSSLNTCLTLHWSHDPEDAAGANECTAADETGPLVEVAVVVVSVVELVVVVVVLLVLEVSVREVLSMWSGP